MLKIVSINMRTIIKPSRLKSSFLQFLSSIWTTWWNKVEKDAEKDRILGRTTTKITAFTQITSREENIFPNRVFLTGGKSCEKLTNPNQNQHIVKPNQCVEQRDYYKGEWKVLLNAVAVMLSRICWDGPAK